MNAGRSWEQLLSVERTRLLVVEPSTACAAAWLLIAKSTQFLTVTFAVTDCVVVCVALMAFQQFTQF